MKHPLLLLMSLCLAVSAMIPVCSMAQTPLPRLASDTLPAEREYFEFHTIDRAPVVSLYKTIDFLDSRTDTSCIGMVEITDKKVVRLVLQTPVQPQLSALLTAYSAPDAGDGELLFQLRRFSFAEPFGSRYCYLAATLYAKQGERYAPLANLDTTFLLFKGLRKAIRIETKHILSEFLAAHMGTRPAGAVSYSLDELTRLDSLEKQQMALYTTTRFADGFYSAYSAFRDQRPDLHGEVKVDADGRVSHVKILDKAWKNAQRDHIYALVYNGDPYVVTYLGIWPLEKIGDDFYFTGKLKLSASSQEIAGAYVMFGVAGVLGRNALGDKMVCRVMLDHQNGEFIHKKILAVD